MRSRRSGRCRRPSPPRARRTARAGDGPERAARAGRCGRRALDRRLLHRAAASLPGARLCRPVPRRRGLERDAPQAGPWPIRTARRRSARPVGVPAHLPHLRDRHGCIGRRGLRDRLCLGARDAAAAAADRVLHPDPVLDFGPDARLRLAGAALQSRARQQLACRPPASSTAAAARLQRIQRRSSA